MRQLLAVLCLAGCAPAPHVTPSAGPTSGHFTVTAEDESIAALEGTLTVTVGGVRALNVERIDPRTVRFVVQGHPEGGRQPLVVATRRASVTPGSFDYRAPGHPVLARVVAMGASLTMGSQDGSISQRSQLHGPAVQLTKAAGAYLGLPLLAPDALPTLTVDDIDPVGCAPRSSDIFATIAQRAAEGILPKVRDRDGNVNLARLRADPSLTATNVAIGGFRITEVVDHAHTAFGTILEHIVWDPSADAAALVTNPRETMLDRVVALNPTLVVTTDLYGNDFNNVNLRVDGVPDLGALTPVAEMRAALVETLDALDATGAEVFVATGPDATLLPQYDAKIAEFEAKGYPRAEASAWREGLRQRIRDYNAVLLEEAPRHPRVHVVDLWTKVNEIFERGLDVGGEHLTAQPFHGLLSLDSMHFSDTGYAVLANELISSIVEATGARIPLIDLAQVHAEDPYAVEALRTAGLGCAGR